ncbi:MAG: SusD/RagB family nutrient-binding outer membrane lipoprotein, partial [bacterium]
FMQQMAGVDQQWASFEFYQLPRTNFNAPWFDIYGGGGLLDIETLKADGLAEEKRTLVGVTKLWEALLISTASFFWGDIPYSEAARSDIDTPTYDKQSAVRDQVLQLIDSAIADLNAGQTKVIDIYDFTYAGDAAKWIAAAHTLKARILLNWAEVDNGNYALALAEAQQGIASDADNWVTRHSTTSGEENLWWQFETRRFGYVKAAFTFVDLLRQDNDPRLEVYFGLDQEGNITGSRPGELNSNVSWLNPDTYGSPSWDQELVTWFENQFIIAECQYQTGSEAAALATLNDIIQPGLEAKYGLAANSLPRYTGLTGTAVLEAIMMEKYKALFLNPQVWADWKRTNYPVITPAPGNQEVPRRLLYPEDERNTNPNFPRTDTFFERNENDPN